MQETVLITGGSGFIGTNLIDLLLSLGYNNIVNIDKAKPVNSKHSAYWVNVNIMDVENLQKAFAKYQPEIVIHLAARTDTLSDNPKDYEENSIGTKNIVDVIKGGSYVKHAIITSTQYVYKSLNKPFPETDSTFIPHTVYGHSKAYTEEYTRNANLDCKWTIIRPTNIWGPWHMRYPNELWRMIDKGFYVHPGKKEVIRAYGYVKNVAHQIHQMMIAPPEVTHKKMYYVGDLPIDSYLWLNELSTQMTGKSVKRLPIAVFGLLATVGDVLRKLNISFPLYSERFRNMIEDYYAPSNITVAQFGLSHPDMKANVQETIDWLKNDGKQFFEHWKQK